VTHRFLTEIAMLDLGISDRVECIGCSLVVGSQRRLGKFRVEMVLFLLLP
jgi:hypothetical protein